MRLSLRTAAVFFLLLCLFSLPAQAQTEKLVKIRLVPERGAIQPGETIWVGIEQSIEFGWHTYWKNPGDSGTAPRITWTLPAGFEMGETQWPVPHKLSMGPLTNYGYEDHVTLLQQLKAPATLPEGPLLFSADVEILVCKEECIPEYGIYNLTLNESDEDNAAFIEAARARLPEITSTPGVFKDKKGFLVLEKPVDWNDGLQSYDFIPEDWGVVANAAKPDIKRYGDKIVVKQKRGDRAIGQLSEIRGLLTYTKDNTHYGYAITAKNKVNTNAATSEPSSLPQLLLLAFLGGLILNLMPCVFPVLSLKALSLLQTAEKSPARSRLHGIAYTAGVMLSFLLIAALLIIFRTGGAQVGWGFQLQNPMVVTLLAYLLFVIGMNLAGLFEIGSGFGNIGNKLTQGDGLNNSFFTGILATLVATPCTAPFMAGAIGAALLLPAPAALAIFAALGFGLAFPYLTLSFAPPLQKILPKPGAWMETFRQFLAFPMFASVAWLVWVISQQAGPMGVFGALMGLVFIAFGFWLLKHRPENRFWNYKIKLLALGSFVMALLLLPAGQMAMPEKGAYRFGEAFSREKLATLLEGNDPVFVEMTAAWCITCKINHAVAIDIDSTRKVFTDNNVQYLIGDWTNQDAAITEYLNSFGRNGVPLYVYYAPPVNGKRPDPKVLPQLLTPGIVKNAIEAK